MRSICNLIRAALNTPGVKGRMGLPILLEGPPGSTKSSTIEMISALAGLHTETVIASIREPADMTGLPIVDEETVNYAPPGWARRALAAKHAVVFFDEINTSAPAVQAALLRVILDGVVGDLPLPPTVRFIAAQNSTEDAAGGWDLAPPLANRFGHLQFEVLSVDEWSDWLLSGGDTESPADAKLEVERVMKAWPSPFAKAKGLVTGFLRRRPELLLKQPKSGDTAASKAWPSPRTWEMATRALAGAEVHGLTKVETDLFVEAFIGHAAATEVATYRKAVDLPDPADILDGKATFKHDPKRLDRTAAILSSCAALVASKAADKRQPRAGALWGILGTVLEDAADLAVPACRALVEGGLVIKEARPILAKLNPVLEAAGIRAS